MKTLQHRVEFCVVGGGIAGLCAAISAARHGVKTLLVHDRPVLGGNASSEIRMWICGSYGTENRETGLVEEFELENLYRNPEASFSLWDSVLYGKAMYQDNLTVLLNTTCTEAVMDGSRLKSIRAWEMNAETWHEIQADLFSDCSGDSILAPLTGAEFRLGREASSEFNEDIAPEKQDCHTMGNSCLLQCRELTRPVEFIAPEWAFKYKSFDQFPHRGDWLPYGLANYWWIEIGGMDDSIHNPAQHREELVKTCFGVWDLVKHHPDTREKMKNWELEWVGYLPGKRESRRYVGDLIMNQNDVCSKGAFEDTIAYGGWSMDDHHPEGLHYPGPPNVFYEAPAPYGIPYRCLYSKNISNLFCAGRNISVTHTALSSTRVMKTCGTLGQAVGTAAAIAVRNHISPRGVYEKHVDELQQMLMADDCYLPGFKYRISPLNQQAALAASNGKPAENLRSGLNRSIGSENRPWTGRPGDAVAYTWDKTEQIHSLRIVCDTDFGHRRHNIIANRPLDFKPFHLPGTLVRDADIEIRNQNGEWTLLHQLKDNHNRLFKLECGCQCTGLRLTVKSTWGNEECGIFAFDFA